MFHFFIYYRVRRDEEIVCYADVGCFRDDGPFNYLDMLPSPPEEVSTNNINSKIMFYNEFYILSISKHV